MIAMRNRHHQARHYHLWDVVATLAAVLVGQAAAGATGAGAEDPAAAVLVHHGAAATVGRAGAGLAEDTQAQASKYSPQFLTYVDQVIDDLVRVHNAFWTEGQWYNMTLKSDSQNLFSLFYDKPGAIQVTTDPTGVYGKLYL